MIISGLQYLNAKHHTVGYRTRNSGNGCGYKIFNGVNGYRRRIMECRGKYKINFIPIITNQYN